MRKARLKDGLEAYVKVRVEVVDTIALEMVLMVRVLAGSVVVEVYMPDTAVTVGVGLTLSFMISRSSRVPGSILLTQLC
jgi:hypothetical protein